MVVLPWAVTLYNTLPMKRPLMFWKGSKNIYGMYDMGYPLSFVVPQVAKH